MIHSGTSARTLIILSLVFFTLLPYSNAPLNDFVYDDRTAIVDNPTVQDIRNIGTALTHDYWYGTDLSGSALYRPLTIISYIINEAVSGTSPFSFHMVNVILHLIVVLLIFFFVSLLFEEATIPFISSLLFAVHPIHTEAVTGIVGRAELLAAFFFIAALILHIKGSDDKRSRLSGTVFLVASLFSYFFALLSKENAIVYPAFVIVVSAFMECGRSKLHRMSILKAFTNWKVLFSFSGSIAVTIVYSVIRSKVLGARAFHASVSALDNPIVQADLYERIVTACVLLFKYAFLLLFPIKLSADYSAWQIPLSSFPPSAHDLLSVVFAIILVFLLIFAYHRSKDFFLPLALFMIAYIIPSNLFVTIGTIFAERLIYLPSLGICLLFAVASAWIISTMKERKQHAKSLPAAYTVICIIIVLFAARTFIRNFDWKDNFTLYSRTAGASPKSARAHGNLGQVLAEMHHRDEALKEFQLFVSIYPDAEQIHINSAKIYIEQGKHREAEKEYREAIRVNPDSPYAHFHLGSLYATLGREEDAAHEYSLAIKLKPAYTDALNNLGALYLEMENYAEALKFFDRAWRAEPELILPLRNMGETYVKLLEYQKAEQVFNIYLEKERSDFKAYYLLAHALAGQKRYEDAIAAMKRSIELNDSFPDSHSFLSSLYKMIGMEDESIRELRIYDALSREQSRGTAVSF